jgi:hypothetical protein
MKIETLIGISIFTMLSVWTVYSWMDRWSAVSTHEGFAPTIDSLVAATSGAPSNQDIQLAYQTILKYIKTDFSKGIIIVNHFKSKFFPPDTPFKDGFDPARITDDPQLRLLPENNK